MTADELETTHGQLSTHFDWSEVTCNHCGQLPAQLADDAKKQAVFMEKVRALFALPIHINSWYRCPVWNAKVGGADHSYHMKAQACDITIKSMTPAAVQKKLRGHFGKNGFVKGLGQYRGFTHTDERGGTGTPVKWNG